MEARFESFKTSRLGKILEVRLYEPMLRGRLCFLGLFDLFFACFVFYFYKTQANEGNIVIRKLTKSIP